MTSWPWSCSTTTTALWKRYFLLTLLLQHPFSAISSSPLPEKCLALNGSQGMGLVQLFLSHFNSFHLIPLETLTVQAGTTGILSLLKSVCFPAGMLHNMPFVSSLPTPMKGWERQGSQPPTDWNPVNKNLFPSTLTVDSCRSKVPSVCAQVCTVTWTVIKK